MEVINLSASNSILNQYIKELRSVDIQKDSMRFRRNIARIGNIMAYEISKRMAYENDKVTTPLGVADVPVIADQVVLGTILRAGLPFHQGFLDCFDHAHSFTKLTRQNLDIV